VQRQVQQLLARDSTQGVVLGLQDSEQDSDTDMLQLRSVECACLTSKLGAGEQRQLPATVMCRASALLTLPQGARLSAAAVLSCDSPSSTHTAQQTRTVLGWTCLL
jgi:hypothetical protein